MTIHKRAAAWLRDHGSIVLACAALLLAMSVSLAAQDRSNARPSDSGDHGRVAAPRSGGDSSSVGSTSSTPPRTAQPAGRDRQPSRQPPSARSDRGGRGGHGGHHGGGHFHPGFYRYPYWSGSWWGWWWWDPYWTYPTGPYYGGGYRGGGGGDGAGALDLDVSPGRTQVYLDGEHIGTVDNFDGWPQYLWLEDGTYDLVLYLDGYKTLARQVTIYPGVVQNMNDVLEPGPSTRPEDIPSKSTERREERLRRDRENQEQSEAATEDWRERVRRERGKSDDEVRDVRREGGRLRLKIEPDDASVYLDGHFVGTADELAALRAGLLVDPGEHTLSVVRPGHQSADKEFTVDPGEEIEVEIELEEIDV